MSFDFDFGTERYCKMGKRDAKRTKMERKEKGQFDGGRGILYEYDEFVRVLWDELSYFCSLSGVAEDPKNHY